jgi:hypothetical protein
MTVSKTGGRSALIRSGIDNGVRWTGKAVAMFVQGKSWVQMGYCNFRNGSYGGYAAVSAELATASPPAEERD